MHKVLTPGSIHELPSSEGSHADSDLPPLVALSAEAPAAELGIQPIELSRTPNTRRHDFATGAVIFEHVVVDGLQAMLEHHKVDHFGRPFMRGNYAGNIAVSNSHRLRHDPSGEISASIPISAEGSFMFVHRRALEATKLELARRLQCGWDAQIPAFSLIGKWLMSSKFEGVQSDGLFVYDQNNPVTKGILFWPSVLR